MSSRVEWAKRALKELSRLDRPTQDRIASAVEEFAEDNQGDVRRLQGSSDDAFRLRVGGWRVIFSHSEDGTILILRIRPRGDAYKR